MKNPAQNPSHPSTTASLPRPDRRHFHALAANTPQTTGVGMKKHKPVSHVASLA
jgi:hypothetical protein